MRFAYPQQYSYSECVQLPSGGNKSAKITGSTNTDDEGLQIVVKPNPAGNTVTFNYQLPQKVQTALLSLYNAGGKMVFKKQLNSIGGNIHYNCSHLNQGVYYYTLSTPDKTVSGKLVIVR